MLIDFIGHYDDFRIFGQNINQALEFFGGINAAGGVAGSAKQHHASGRGDGGFKLCRGNLKVLFNGRIYCYNFTFSKFDHFNVANPCRSGDDYFIAGVDSGKDNITQSLLGTITHYDLFRSECDAILFLKFFADGFTDAVDAWTKAPATWTTT